MNARAVRALNENVVRDVMKSEMLTVVPEMTVYELAQTLLQAGVSSAPVVGPTGSLAGVASLAEVARMAMREGLAPCAPPDGAGATDGDGTPRADAPSSCPPGVECLRVRDMMGPPRLTVSPGEPLLGLIRHFVQARVQRALVVEHEMLLGLVTAVDVLNLIDGGV